MKYCRSILCTATVTAVLSFTACQNATKTSSLEENHQETTGYLEKDTVQKQESSKAVNFIYEPAGFENISLTAYVNDPDEKNPTNVRATPKGEVITELYRGYDYAVDIIGQQDGWFKISHIEIFDENNAVDMPREFGWIHHSVLSLDTRNYDAPLKLYELPETSSNIVHTLNNARQVRFSKVYRNFVYVYFSENNKKIEGWLPQDWLCGDPIRNCN